MAKKKAYPLRMDETILMAMQRLADDELRSLNAQIEYVCRQALRDAGRLPASGKDSPHDTQQATGQDAEQDTDSVLPGSGPSASSKRST